jgi:hypothetical protein
MAIVLAIATLLGGITAIWFFWDKYREKNTANNINSQKYRREKTLIKTKITKELAKDNFVFGLLHVRNGKDQIPDHSPLLNNEKEPDLVGDMLIFNVEFNGHLGFQFKCFVDYGRSTQSVEYSKVKSMLEDAGFSSITEDGGKSKRAWFILPKYEVCTTNDGFTNNFYSPS